MKNSSTIIRKSLTRIVDVIGWKAESYSKGTYERKAITTNDAEDGGARCHRDARVRRADRRGGAAGSPSEDLPRRRTRRERDPAAGRGARDLRRPADPLGRSAAQGNDGPPSGRRSHARQSDDLG